MRKNQGYRGVTHRIPSSDPRVQGNAGIQFSWSPCNPTTPPCLPWAEWCEPLSPVTEGSESPSSGPGGKHPAVEVG